MCPDSKAETDRKNRKPDGFQESACEHKKFEIHGLQRKACGCVLSWRSITMAMKHSHKTISCINCGSHPESGERKWAAAHQDGSKGPQSTVAQTIPTHAETECCKLNSWLDAAERDNGHLRADLRKDAGEVRRMRDSMRGLRHRALDCGENMIS